MAYETYIDIRSDTVTRPTEAMRKAMAAAEVGDDVYGDDPTVRALEELGAGLVKKEAALFVPSGTFGNQLALFTCCGRGTEVILGEECHIIQHEAGAASVIAGVQTRTISAPDGALPADAVASRLRKRELHFPATSLICVENAHSLGRAVPLAAMIAIQELASQWGLPVHLDGARVFNAACALGCTAADIAARATTVMFCLSKGLCAPVGSLLAGPAALIEEARYKRKIMGGGMRQAGILAAAGIIALQTHPALLAADHARARRLEQGLAALGAGGIAVLPGDINLVFFRIADKAKAAAAAAAFRARGILINPPDLSPSSNSSNSGGAWLFRFATHYWIGDSEVEKILAASREIFL
ncbi:MAG: aminotransferase class I/II-fold pyridoxal phosphate-dependent enzyme [Treponema sp.]|nr:aminotransferase class I/II-fold pyridoxal phosphate-dependent enzyme [Treponema sp.]